MCKGGRRTSGCIPLIPQPHGCDKTAVPGEQVKNFAVRENIPFKTPDELVRSDADPTPAFLRCCKRFHMGIKFTPLSSLIGVDFFFSDNFSASDALGQLTCSVSVLMHRRCPAC